MMDVLLHFFVPLLNKSCAWELLGYALRFSVPLLHKPLGISSEVACAILKPTSGCFLISAHSSSLSLPGFDKILASTPILPISCKVANSSSSFSRSSVRDIASPMDFDSCAILSACSSVSWLFSNIITFIDAIIAVSYTHLRAHETRHDLVCRLLLEK